jgi:hypothetical protein
MLWLNARLTTNIAAGAAVVQAFNAKAAAKGIANMRAGGQGFCLIYMLSVPQITFSQMLGATHNVLGATHNVPSDDTLDAIVTP